MTRTLPILIALCWCAAAASAHEPHDPSVIHVPAIDFEWYERQLASEVARPPYSETSECGHGPVLVYELMMVECPFIGPRHEAPIFSFDDMERSFCLYPMERESSDWPWCQED